NGGQPWETRPEKARGGAPAVRGRGATPAARQDRGGRTVRAGVDRRIHALTWGKHKNRRCRLVLAMRVPGRASKRKGGRTGHDPGGRLLPQGPCRGPSGPRSLSVRPRQHATRFGVLRGG